MNLKSAESINLMIQRHQFLNHNDISNSHIITFASLLWNIIMKKDRKEKEIANGFNRQKLTCIICRSYVSSREVQDAKSTVCPLHPFVNIILLIKAHGILSTKGVSKVVLIIEEKSMRRTELLHQDAATVHTTSVDEPKMLQTITGMMDTTIQWIAQGMMWDSFLI
ncbi:hypothetical protein BDA99DRAFT_542404 [Phascolomyces articulosus]|uniref:Uncharacterized protein n=1 Tax=Phascolomyces articulosus TaxID=60185 RepID=A0AAD5P998_9FUNG|nr:hypothetical protein BDA99DRAFT_542404 [Phascolomyces articulosus]